jgi:hypothetical protein
MLGHTSNTFAGYVLAVGGATTATGVAVTNYLAMLGATVVVAESEPKNRPDRRDDIIEMRCPEDSLTGAVIAKYGRLDAAIYCATALDCDGGAELSAKRRALQREIADAESLLSGAIAHMNSSMGGQAVVVLPGQGAFGVSSARNQLIATGALIYLVRSLALDAGEATRVNALSPILATDLPDGFFEANPHLDRTRYSVDSILSAVAALAHRSCPLSGTLISAGAGRIARVAMVTGVGLFAPDLEPDEVWANGPLVTSVTGSIEPASTLDETLFTEM